MSDYRVEVRVKNNNLLRKLEEAGYSSIGEFCRRNDKVSWNSTIGEFANLKKSPLNRYGKFLPIVEEICDILLCSPEDLFSEVQLTTALESNRRTMEVNEAEMQFMLETQKETLAIEHQVHNERLPGKIEELLETLTPREAKVVAMRFGLGDYDREHLFHEIGKHFEVSSHRIKQIVDKALRKLRHPRRHEMVLDYLEA